jgi:hypothetical protein
VDQVFSFGSKISLLALLAVISWQCLDSPNYPIEPQIEFISLSKDTMRQGIFQQDSVIVTFSFQDGDGDLGRTNQEPQNNIFFTDLRTGTVDNTFAIPALPQDGAGNGVEGTIRILLFSTCCIYNDGNDPCTPNPDIPLDTVQYKIQITDRAGHVSNEIVTTPIILLCN